MSTIKRAARLLLHPDAEGRIVRLSFIIHWILGGIAVVALYGSSPPLALTLFVVGVIFFGVLAGASAIVGAHVIWSLMLGSQIKASEFMLLSSRSILRQLIYLAPGLLVAPLLLLLIAFIANEL